MYAREEPETVEEVWDGLFKLMEQGSFKGTVYNDRRFSGLESVGEALAMLGRREVCPFNLYVFLLLTVRTNSVLEKTADNQARPGEKSSFRYRKSRKAVYDESTLKALSLIFSTSMLL